MAPRHCAHACSIVHAAGARGHMRDGDECWRALAIPRDQGLQGRQVNVAFLSFRNNVNLHACSSCQLQICNKIACREGRGWPGTTEAADSNYRLAVRKESRQCSKTIAISLPYSATEVSSRSPGFHCHASP